MKTNILSTGLMAVALLAFTACGSNDQHDHNDGEQHEHMQGDSASTMHKEHAAAYHCAMNCEGDKTYAEPGKCPVCNMDLVVVE
ncbi:MAG: hypothetical protein IPP83_10880 [Flavobacteriales bacterium]|nr:hypothetical protein [Flavobacteriales bacterium]